LRRVHSVAVEGFGAPLPAGGWSCVSWLDALRETYEGVLPLDTKRELFSADLVTRLEALTFYNARLDIPASSLIH
jgi:hypothetical protein